MKRIFAVLAILVATTLALPICGSAGGGKQLVVGYSDGKIIAQSRNISELLMDANANLKGFDAWREGDGSISVAALSTDGFMVQISRPGNLNAIGGSVPDSAVLALSSDLYAIGRYQLALTSDGLTLVSDIYPASEDAPPILSMDRFGPLGIVVVDANHSLWSVGLIEDAEHGRYNWDRPVLIDDQLGASAVAVDQTDMSIYVLCAGEHNARVVLLDRMGNYLAEAPVRRVEADRAAIAVSPDHDVYVVRNGRAGDTVLRFPAGLSGRPKVALRDKRIVAIKVI